MSRTNVLDPFDLGTLGLDQFGWGSAFLGLLGDDNLFGTGLKDLMFDLYGNDILTGGGGDDLLFGGFGDDILNGDSAVKIKEAVTLFVNKELIGNDLLWGGFGDDILNGNGGNDKLFGSFGNDTLNGGSGNDWLAGGFGDDSLTGGEGKDIFAVSFGHDVITDFSHDTKTTEVLIDFEGISIFGWAGLIPNGYKGLDWIDAGVTEANPYPATPGSGYDEVLNSGDYCFFGGFPSSFQDPLQDFNFQSGYFASAWQNDLNFMVEAFDDGIAVGSAEIVLDRNKVFIDFSAGTAEGADNATFSGRFTSVDKIQFTSFPQIAADDLVLTYTTPGDGDVIDLPGWMDAAQIVDSATSDGSGGALLDHDLGTIQLLGVNPVDVAVEWFV